MMSNICIVCGNKITEILHKKFGKYYYCAYCEFISKDRDTILDPADELKIYERHNNSIDDPRYVAYFKKFIDACIIGFAGENITGLDFGSGPSPVLAQILKRDYDIDMDIYDQFYSPQRAYEGKKYGLITCTEVAEHLDDPISYFRLFRSLLNENGIISIKTAFHPVCVDEFLDWYYIRDMTHISFYTKRTLDVIGGSIGHKIIYTDNKEYAVFARSE